MFFAHPNNYVHRGDFPSDFVSFTINKLCFTGNCNVLHRKHRKFIFVVFISTQAQVYFFKLRHGPKWK